MNFRLFLTLLYGLIHKSDEKFLKYEVKNDKMLHRNCGGVQNVNTPLREAVRNDPGLHCAGRLTRRCFRRTQ